MTVYLHSWAFWSTEEDQNESPELPFLASRTKRRMSQLSRMILGVGHQLLQDSDVDDVVFASRYGELRRQLKITDGIIDDGEVSPTDFSYSVFNTPVALLSLNERIHGVTRAVYAGPESFERGLLQSLLLVGTGKPDHVLFLYGDESIPAFYGELVSEKDRPLAVGMVISRIAAGLPRSVSNNAPDVLIDLEYDPNLLKVAAGDRVRLQGLVQWLKCRDLEPCIVSSGAQRMIFRAGMD